jgi:hypothetical protein
MTDLIFELIGRLIKLWDRDRMTVQDLATVDERLRVRREHAVEARRRELAAAKK